VYERMLSLNLKPNASTYVALLTAFARTGQLEAALAIFRWVWVCGVGVWCVGVWCVGVWCVGVCGGRQAGRWLCHAPFISLDSSPACCV
jgi:hypothetical protein